MPDFTEEVHFHCRSAEDWETTVPASNGGTYRVWVGYANWPGAAKYEFQCECKGFQFRKTCKHVKAAKESDAYCGWQQFVHGGAVVRDEQNIARCPECGDITYALRYAV